MSIMMNNTNALWPPISLAFRSKQFLAFKLQLSYNFEVLYAYLIQFYLTNPYLSCLNDMIQSCKTGLNT